MFNYGNINSGDLEVKGGIEEFMFYVHWNINSSGIYIFPLYLKDF
jgi:hypothetical protein